LDSDNQNELIGGIPKSCALNLPLDDLFWMTFFKSIYLSFSNKITTLKLFVDFCCLTLYIEKKIKSGWNLYNKGNVISVLPWAQRSSTHAQPEMEVFRLNVNKLG